MMGQTLYLVILAVKPELGNTIFSPQWSGNLNAEWILSLGDNLEQRTNLDINISHSEVSYQ
jgi:hypothetical protein